MTTIYLLHHAYDIGDFEETKLIGAYSSEANAEAAAQRLRSKPGFSRLPDAFTISPYLLDEDHWTEGFVSSVGIYVPDKEGNWMVVDSSLHGEGIFEIVEHYRAHELGPYKHGDLVLAEWREGEGWFALHHYQGDPPPAKSQK